MPGDGGRLGIMQPYFFPYLGHFALIASVDRWVVFDVTHYTPKSWMSRNRVLHPHESWMYVTAPVRGASRSRLIRDIELDQPDDALRSLNGKLAHYKKSAPHYREVLELVERAYAGRTEDSLVALDASGLGVVCEYLGIDFDYSICSELDLDLSGVAHPGQWALRISQQLGADEYLNPVGGADLFRPEEFGSCGIRLGFVALPPMPYDPEPYSFIPSLSVLDVLMWNDPATVRRFVHDSTVITTPASVDHA